MITYTNKLTKLFEKFPFFYSPYVLPDVHITGIAIDSRKVLPGNLFVAMRGHTTDGHKYIKNAVDKGAAAVVGEYASDELSVPFIKVENSRQALTHLAAAFYGYPGNNLTVIGVTGTDGKTTTSHLIYNILLEAGHKVGMISTVNAIIGDEIIDTGFHVTTPDAHDVQLYLARMVDKGVKYVVLETTSHGLAQYRTDAAEYDIGVVTNITHEHLDEHGSYENYRAAKGRLFTLLSETPSKPHGNIRLGVLNYDDTLSYEYLHQITSTAQISYGLDPKADIRAEKIIFSPNGITFHAISKDFNVQVKSTLVGNYNVCNCLAAISATVNGIGISPEIAARGISNLVGIPGRMERINMGQNFTAIVDFAHTPNALKVTLETARKMTNKRVIVVFGSAGLRDKAKRRMMSEVAVDLADVSILTAEDPRTESLNEILAEMAAGAESRGGVKGKSFYIIRDRGEAIRFAVKLAQEGDIVLACGKGHEQSMCFGITEYLWDDRVAMRAALSDLLRVPGPSMPYLPTQDGIYVD